ncbi:hypothetical protein [Streptomyces sp. NPDC008001]|uniref:hypothetical protein n=1 Tax=Streptomyces sp. NPDC008001 TaxID=3364804 RepID=UPI0036E8880E
MFSDIGPFEAIAIGVVIVAVYVVPSVIAFRRRHPNRLLMYLATRPAPERVTAV